MTAGGEDRKPPIARAVLLTINTLPRLHLRMTLAGVAVVVAMGAVPALFRVMTGEIVGDVQRHAGEGWAQAGRQVLPALVVLGGLFAVQQVLGPIRIAVGDALGRILAGNLRSRAMAAATRPSGVAHLEDPAMLDKISLAQGVGTNQITPRGFVLGLTGLSARYLQGIASGALLFPFRWWLPFLLAGSFLAVIRWFHRAFKKQLQLAINETGVLRRSEYFRDLALTPGAAKESRVFGLGAWISERHRASWFTAMADVWKERQGSYRLSLIGGGAIVGCQLLAFLMLGRAAARGEISIQAFTVYTQAVFGMSVFANLSEDDLNVEYAAASIPAVIELEEIAEGLDTRPASPRSAAGLPAQGIRFEGVSFRYPGRDADVFRDLDLEIPAGHSLAIVGENGAGKTTLVKLLAGLYQPTSGRITVDGIDIRELDPTEWQHRLAAIFQDFVRYQLPAADNVGLGADTSDRAALEDAARKAGAFEIVEQLPSGWETTLSRQFTGGADLSGGQWQKVALARAFHAVGRGARVLVLDEPTANLDVRAEADLYDRFLDLTEGLTTIVISHRFSTVRRASRIVVLEDGRVVEDGTHDGLLAAGGRYARMFRLQAARFDDPNAGDDELALVGEESEGA